jgi:hypothetical protein
MVSLGEASHGTHEFYAERARIDEATALEPLPRGAGRAGVHDGSLH